MRIDRSLNCARTNSMRFFSPPDRSFQSMLFDSSTLPAKSRSRSVFFFSFRPLRSVRCSAFSDRETDGVLGAHSLTLFDRSDIERAKGGQYARHVAVSFFRFLRALRDPRPAYTTFPRYPRVIKSRVFTHGNKQQTLVNTPLAPRMPRSSRNRPCNPNTSARSLRKRTSERASELVRGYQRNPARDRLGFRALAFGLLSVGRPREFKLESKSSSSPYYPRHLSSASKTPPPPLVPRPFRRPFV